MKQTKTNRTAGFLWDCIRPNLRQFAAGVLFMLVSTAFSTLTPQVVRTAVDTLVAGRPEDLPAALQALPLLRQPMWVLWLAAAGVLATAALGGVCSYLSQMGVARASETAMKSLRDRLFAHIQRLPFLWHTQNQTGDIVQRCTSDVEVVHGFISMQLTEVFRTIVLVAFTVGVMFSMHAGITLIAVVYLPIIVLYSFVFYRGIGKRFLAADEAEGALSSIAQENLTGVRVVRAFGRERYETDRFNKQNDLFSRMWLRLGRLLSTYWSLTELITGIQVLAVSLAGIFVTVHGSITLGTFLAFISYDISLLWPVRGLGRILSEMSKAGVSIGRLRYILESEEEQDTPDALEPPMDGDIVFSHVTYGFDDAHDVLRDVSFTIPAGSTFAILGGTGSGKSTLMHLLGRLYDLPPENGRIIVGGVDIARVKRGWLRKHIGMVLQEPFLFSRTIEENIRAAKPDADRGEVRRAAQVAAVDHAVLAFPNGYETMVGERGVTLSGGQKQRVAIARTLLQGAPILVFDDSLSAVDTETDAKIRAALHESTGGATVILISHRVTTLMQADRILVLEDGRVSQLGTHAELTAQPGIYRAICEAQTAPGTLPPLEQEEAAHGV